MKHTWMIAAFCCAAACVSPEAHRQVVGANEALRAEIAGMADQMRTLAAENGRLATENADLGKRAVDAAWIEEQKKKLGDLLAKYGAGTQAAVDGVELVRTAEGYAFRVAGEVLFSSGQNALTEQGKRTLAELASSLQGHRIRVEGHTDDQPIVRSQWGTNLRLSVERAMSVADFLIQNAQLPAQRVSCAGYGEFRPAVEGATDAARQKNRRVEILLLNH
jgi:chemotaxis protein MotB